MVSITTSAALSGRPGLTPLDSDTLTRELHCPRRAYAGYVAFAPRCSSLAPHLSLAHTLQGHIQRQIMWLRTPHRFIERRYDTRQELVSPLVRGRRERSERGGSLKRAFCAPVGHRP